MKLNENPTDTINIGCPNRREATDKDMAVDNFLSIYTPTRKNKIMFGIVFS